MDNFTIGLLMDALIVTGWLAAEWALARSGDQSPVQHGLETHGRHLPRKGTKP